MDDDGWMDERKKHCSTSQTDPSGNHGDWSSQGRMFLPVQVFPADGVLCWSDPSGSPWRRYLVISPMGRCALTERKQSVKSCHSAAGSHHFLQKVVTFGGESSVSLQAAAAR